MIKWQIGPVKLANGWDATIYRYCENRKRYIGEARDKDWFYAAEWMADGSWNVEGSPCNALNLAPPPKKTVRLQRWINVNFDGTAIIFSTKEGAERNRSDDFMACLVIDEVVTEGMGYSE